MPEHSNKEDTAPYIDLGLPRVITGSSLFFRVFLSILALSCLPAFFITVLITFSYQIDLGGGFFVILGVLFILIGFLAFIISQSITRPIIFLNDAIKRISGGDLKARVNLDRGDEFGNLAHFFNAMMDKFTETQERNLSISRLKSQFVTVAAHQMRTPLSALKWTMRLLLDGDVGAISEEQKQLLDRGYQTNERMIDLVNDMLNVFRIEEGKFGFSF